MIEPAALQATHHAARDRLLSSWRDGAFRGELSGSALSTATAVQAFTLWRRGGADAEVDRLLARGRDWVADHQNEDGGWGDTIDSPSNVSTTTLCWASLGMREARDRFAGVLERADARLHEEFGELRPERISRVIADRYGVDRTFSVPILTACALAGRFGSGPEAWKPITGLPFELVTLPFAFFAWIGLPTVSYALPALVAMGQVHHHHRPTWFLPWRWLRSALRRRTLDAVREMQPASGGFLEAAPLTSFVSMCLIESGQREHPVVQHGLRFLRETARPDGSWPIDTNLDTWTTTLAVNALHGVEGDSTGPTLSDEQQHRTRAWLLAQQHRQVHPYTRAAPGGWAWTDLSGGVPDADDTSGALLALAKLAGRDDHGRPDAPTREAAALGARWLLDLQNRDGGVPTFCRGWGKLPFDRSSPDLTAHAVRAWSAWREDLAELGEDIDRALGRAVDFLVRDQRDDGAWVPLWFGNQHAPKQESPLYGTSRVLSAIATVAREEPAWAEAGERARDWIRRTQNDGGGWGGDRGVDSTVEETGWALEALAGSASPPSDATERGIRWLLQRTERGATFPTAPVGLYFAKLWYSERLYPVLATAAASKHLGR